MTDVDAASAPAARVGPGLGGLLDELRWRGMFHEATPGLERRLAAGPPLAGYNGFDPTAASLHIGHLVPIFGLIHFQRRGGRPVALVGGATGMVGDPSGRSSERNLLDRATLEANVASIRDQLARFLDFSPGAAQAEMANNLEWTQDVTVLDFLRDVGKHFTVPYMLAKDSVQQRMERGLSFTEFSYMLLQAFDFRHLYARHGVELQMGGADQWGNITAGLELIRRSVGGGDEPAEERAHGLAYPLLLAPSGAKFGKTEGGESVWLDPNLTSPYAFYQYWLNADDRDVAIYLRWFTLLGRKEIETLEGEQAARPEARPAQRALARDLTARVHGAAEAARATELSEAIFSGRLGELSEALLVAAARELPHAQVPAAAGATAGGLALAAGAYGSNGELRRGIAGGGLYVNDVRVTDANEAAPAPLHGRFWIIRTGKRNQRIVERSG
ncbi:MAG TPA: tyrosine--tRNA ligase [Candidatus Limnocylindrales bacterium]|nr:tyrosine--tRNA ligase [Candidatus Limnocylindrales bacterium]